MAQMNTIKTAELYPQALVHYRKILKYGQMIPVRVGKGRVALVIRDTDARVVQMGRDPMVYALPSSILYGNVRLVWLLIRINKEARWAYETGFDVTKPECIADAEALYSQQKILLQVVGDNEWTSIDVEMKAFQHNLKAHIEMALGHRHEWSGKDFLKGVGALRSVTTTPFHLWDILEREGQMLEIR